MIATIVIAADGTSVQNIIQPHDMSMQFVSFSIVNTRNVTPAILSPPPETARVVLCCLLLLSMSLVSFHLISSITLQMIDVMAFSMSVISSGLNISSRKPKLLSIISSCFVMNFFESYIR